MRVVVDASAVFAWLTGGGSTQREPKFDEATSLHAPSHVDVECLSAIRRGMQRGTFDRQTANSLASGLLALPVIRYEIAPLVPRILQLSENASAYDAAYLALAEGLGAELWTADYRLASVPGVHCRVRLL